MADTGTNRELAIAVTSSAGLELFWSAAAIGAALFGIAGTAPLTMSAVAAIALGFTLLARGGALAARWPSPPAGEPSSESEAIGLNVFAGLIAIALGALAITGVAPYVLAPLALLLLAGALVLDAPLEPALAAPRGYWAAGFMALAGLAAIVVLTAAFAARGTHYDLVPWAALVAAAAYAIAAAAVLLRFVRRDDADDQAGLSTRSSSSTAVSSSTFTGLVR
jgi:hypothetical protein